MKLTKYIKETYNMRKFLAFALSILFLLQLAACGDPTETTGQDEITDPVETDTPITDAPTTNAPETTPPESDFEVPSDPTFNPDEEIEDPSKKMIFEYDFTAENAAIDGFTVGATQMTYVAGEGFKSAANNCMMLIKDQNIALKGKSIMVEADIIFDVLPHKAEGVTNFPLSIITWIRESSGNISYDWAIKIDENGVIYVKDTTIPTETKIEADKKYTFGVLYSENDSILQVYLDGVLVGTRSFSPKELTGSSIRIFDSGNGKAHFSATVCGARAYLFSTQDMLKDAEISVFDYKAGNANASVYFAGYTDKDAISYAVDEEINLEIYLIADNTVVSAPYFYYKVNGEDGQKQSEGYVDGSKGHFTVTGKMSKAGALRVEAYVCDENKVKLTKNNSNLYVDLATSTPQKADLCFKGGAIAGFDDITAGGKIPSDLKEYWDSVVADCYKGDIKLLRFEELDPTKYGGTNQHYLYLVEIECEGGFATGYLSVPKNKDSLKLRCNFVSYGAAKKPEPYFSENYATFAICAHSYHLDDPNASVESNYGFNNSENQNRDTVYFKNMFIRNLTATRFLKAYIGNSSYGKIVYNGKTIAPLNKWNVGDEYYVQGGSQAAFQSVAITAMDRDVTKASFGVPWFCDIGDDLVGRFSGWNPSYTDALMYYDCCALATLIEKDVTVDITAGLGDTTSEPSGVIALYNALNCTKKMSMIQNRDHTYQAPQAKVYIVKSNG